MSLSSSSLKERYLHIFKQLEAHNPSPATELIYHSRFELLIAVMLSAQATDVGVNKATQALFQAAKTPQDFLDLGLEGLKTYIKTINFFPTKAKHILLTCQQLIDKHQGEVPAQRKDLEALPGVGRKTANVVLNAFNQPTIAVDTHIFRVANRTGLATGKDVLTVERKLEKNLPEIYRLRAHHWLILHGRYQCTARKPKCETCCIRDWCQFFKNAD